MFRPRKRKPSEKKQRSPEFYARQATRTVRSRTFWLMLVMGILLFVILFFQLYHLQITRHQEMQTRALDQQTRQTGVSAFRGTLYDRNGSQLAVSVSTETVFLSQGPEGAAGRRGGAPGGDPSEECLPGGGGNSSVRGIPGPLDL